MKLARSDAERARAYIARKRDRARTAGLCTRCCSAPPKPGRVTCAPCSASAVVRSNRKLLRDREARKHRYLIDAYEHAGDQSHQVLQAAPKPGPVSFTITPPTASSARSKIIRGSRGRARLKQLGYRKLGFFNNASDVAAAHEEHAYPFPARQHSDVACARRSLFDRWCCRVRSEIVERSINSLHPLTMKKIGTVDERYQSYNVEMAEVTGGSFWKPYPKAGVSPSPAASTVASSASVPAGMDPSIYEYRPPIDLTNARPRKLAAALGPAYIRVSGTWANTTFFYDEGGAAPKQPPTGFNGVLTRAVERRSRFRTCG